MTQATAKRRNGAALGPMLVSSYALATHFGCSRQYIDQIAAQGVIARQDGKFDLDQSRLKYIAHLRSEHRRSPRTEADAEHTRAKAELLRIRIAEKHRQLVRQDDVDALLDNFDRHIVDRIEWPACTHQPRSDCETKRRTCVPSNPHRTGDDVSRPTRTVSRRLISRTGNRWRQRQAQCPEPRA